MATIAPRASDGTKARMRDTIEAAILPLDAAARNASVTLALYRLLCIPFAPPEPPWHVPKRTFSPPSDEFLSQRLLTPAAAAAHDSGSLARPQRRARCRPSHARA